MAMTMQAAVNTGIKAEEASFIPSGLKKHAKFVSKNILSHVINQVSWIPSSSSNLQQSSLYITGSKFETKNVIECWSISPEHSVSDDDAGSSVVVDGKQLLSEPVQLDEHIHGPNITDIQFVTPETVAIGDEDANVTLYKLVPSSYKVEEVHKWCKLHEVAGGVHVSCDGNDVVSVGQDGKLCLLDAQHMTPSPISTIERADSTALLSVCHVGSKQVVTGALSGLIKLWDLRARPAAPAAIYVNGPLGAVSSMCAHPVQSHVVFAGTYLGTLCLLDLRHTADMVAQINAHRHQVSDVVFHPYHSEHLLTSSTDGTVWHWDASNVIRHPFQGSAGGGSSGRANPWFEGAQRTESLEITTLLDGGGSVAAAVNSVSVERDMLLVASDAASVTLMNIPELG